ncbi:MAG: hypothetical protein K0S08_1918 [Gammaproteobacteria bacterium]|jgi:hypothetical protein|nr:hypothetical protein [Gammaproteobacteria bacterium]
MLGLDFITAGVKWAWNKIRKKDNSPLSEPLITPEVESATPTQLPEQPSRLKRAGYAAARFAFEAEAGIDAFVTLNSILRPFLLAAGDTGAASYGLTIGIGVFVATEYLIRGIMDVKTQGQETPPWKNASNSALTAGKTVAVMTQIAAGLNARSMPGLIVSTGLGFFILALRQLKNDVGSTQIQYDIAVVPDAERGQICTPAKAGNTIGRSLEILTAGVTLSYPPVGIIRALTELGIIDPTTSVIALGAGIPSAIVIGSVTAALSYIGTRSKKSSVEHKALRYVAAADSVIHRVPLSALFMFTAALDINALTQSQSGAVVNISNQFLFADLAFSLARGAAVSGPVAALQGLENYDHASNINELQKQVDAGTYVVKQKLEIKPGFTNALSAFFQGASKIVHPQELIEVGAATDGRPDGSAEVTKIACPLETADFDSNLDSQFILNA